MKIVLTKPKVAVAETTQKQGHAGTSMEVAELIDRIGAAQAEVDKVTAKIKALREQDFVKKYAADMKQLTAMLTEQEGRTPLDVFAQEGEGYSAAVGKRCIARTVKDTELAVKLLNKVEKGLAWKLMAPPVGKLDQYLTPAEREQVLDVGWGDRSVVISKKTLALKKAA